MSGGPEIIGNKDSDFNYNTIFALSGLMMAWDEDIENPRPKDPCVEQLRQYLKSQIDKLQNELKRREKSYEYVEPENIKYIESSERLLRWLASQEGNKKIIELQQELFRKLRK